MTFADSENAISATFVLVVVALVLSVEYPLPLFGSRYASINSEDIAFLIVVGLFVGLTIFRNEFELQLQFPRTTALMSILGGWFVITLCVVLATGRPSAAVTPLWTIKWFEVVIFFVLAQTMIDRTTAHRILTVFLLCGTLLATYAVAAVLIGAQSYRIRVFFGNPNTLGAFFVLLALFSAAFAGYNTAVRKYAYVFASVMAISGVMMTGSRSAVVALIAGTVVLIVFLRSRISVKQAAGFLSVAGLCLAVVLLFITDPRVGRLINWIEVSGSGVSISEGQAGNSFRTRLDLVFRALELFSVYLVFGYGWYSSPAVHGPLDVYYTTLLVEVGLPGFLLTAAFHVSVIKDWIEIRKGVSLLMGSAGLAWYGSILIQSAAGNFIRTPQVMMISVLVLTLCSGLRKTERVTSTETTANSGPTTGKGG